MKPFETCSHRDQRSSAGLCQCVSEMRCTKTSATKKAIGDASNPTVGRRPKVREHCAVLQGHAKMCAQFPFFDTERNTSKVGVRSDWTGGPK